MKGDRMIHTEKLLKREKETSTREITANQEFHS
jgi:hypothetical protein